MIAIQRLVLKKLDNPIPWSQLRNLEIKRDFVVVDLLEAQTKNFLYGPPGVGKTYLALQLAGCIAKGVPFLDTFNIPEAKRVLYVGAENPIIDLKERLLKQESGVGTLPDDLMLHSVFNLDLNTSSGFYRLNTWVEAYHSEVVILDPLYQLTSADESQLHSNNSLRKNMDKLITDYGILELFVHHPTKGSYNSFGQSYSRGLDDLRGAGWAMWLDTAMKIGGQADKPNRVLEFPKLRNAPPRGKMQIHFNGQTRLYEVTDRDTLDDLVQEIKSLGGSCLVPDLEERFRDKPGFSNIGRLIKELKTAERITVRTATKNEYSKPGRRPNVVDVVD